MIFGDKISRMAQRNFIQKSDPWKVHKHGYRRLWAAVFVVTLVVLAYVKYAFGVEASLIAAVVVFATALILLLVENSKK